MNELYELKDGMYWNVEPEEIITQYIWYLKDKNKKQKEVLDKIKEILNNEMYPDIAKRKILELLEEIE